MSQGRGVAERVEINRGVALTAGQPNVLGANINWPLGELIHRLEMRVNIGSTIGTGTARTEGLLQFIKGFRFFGRKRAIPGVSAGGMEEICMNVPGRALWRIDQIKGGTTPFGPVTALGGATPDRVTLNLWFTDPLQLVPTDSTLDTSRYESLEGNLSLGVLSDLYSTAGTAALTTHSVDIYAWRQRGVLPDDERALKWYKQYGFFGPVDPATTQRILLERRGSIFYQRLGIWTATGQGATTPFQGDASDAVIADLDLQQTAGGPWSQPTPFQNVVFDVLQRQNKSDYQLETWPAGWAWIDFLAADGSVESANASADKAILDVVWRNGALPATPQVTVLTEGLRPIGA
jgi:hypothetical protein